MPRVRVCVGICSFSNCQLFSSLSGFYLHCVGDYYPNRAHFQLPHLQRSHLLHLELVGECPAQCQMASVHVELQITEPEMFIIKQHHKISSRANWLHWVLHH